MERGEGSGHAVQTAPRAARVRSLEARRGEESRPTGVGAPRRPRTSKTLPSTRTSQQRCSWTRRQEVVRGALVNGAGMFSGSGADMERKPIRNRWLHQSRTPVDQPMRDTSTRPSNKKRETSDTKALRRVERASERLESLCTPEAKGGKTSEEQVA